MMRPFLRLISVTAVLWALPWVPFPWLGSSAGGDLTAYAAEHLRMGTYNIRMFPCNNNCLCVKQSGFSRCKGRNTNMTNQRALAREIERLRPAVLGVNESLRPKRFARFAEEMLGPEWRFAYSAMGGPQKVGFLYDSSIVELLTRASFRDVFTRLDSSAFGSGCGRRLKGLRPAFACRFRMKDSGFDFIALSVHLKAGPCARLRRAQWRVMVRIVRRLVGTDKDIVILGDFNDYSPGASDSIAFRKRTGFELVTSQLPCTHLPRSTLDHILVSPSFMEAVRSIRVRVGGPCKRYCTKGRTWKRYMADVSDHCPVIADFRLSMGRNTKAPSGAGR